MPRRYQKRRGPNVARSVQRALERAEIGTLAGGALSGVLDRLGVELPHVEALGRDGTYGAGLWIAGKFMKSKMLRHVGAGLLTVAVADLVRSGGVGYAPPAGRQLAGQPVAQIGWGGYGGEEIAGEIEHETVEE